MKYELQDQIELKDFIVKRVKRQYLTTNGKIDLEQTVEEEVNSHKLLLKDQKKYIAKASLIKLNKDIGETAKESTQDIDCAT